MRQQQCEECSKLWSKYGQMMAAYISVANQRDQIATDDPQRLAILESLVSTTESLDEIRAVIASHEELVHGRTSPLGVDGLRRISRETVAPGEPFGRARREARYRRIRNAVLFVICSFPLMGLWFYAGGWRRISSRILPHQPTLLIQPSTQKLMSPLRLRALPSF